MKWLGENHFPKCVYFNFDERPEIKQFFENNKDINRILGSLSLISGVQIDENTLIVFDEIQECPDALNALKYFVESEKQIPLICAGSLSGILQPIPKQQLIYRADLSFSFLFKLVIVFIGC